MDISGARILVLESCATGGGPPGDVLPEADLLCAAAADLLAVARREGPEMILLLVTASDTTGLQVCRQLKEDQELRHIPILCITPQGDTAVLNEALSAGAAECVTGPFESAELASRIGAHISIARLQRQLDETRQELVRTKQQLTDEVAHRIELAERLAKFTISERRQWDAGDFVGQSPILQGTLEAVGRLQQASIPVLITGESGTGKELIARALHFGGVCADGPYLPVNCSAIPNELAESLFFGHLRGAFSGADSDRPGFFELAHGGTLFLDEVSDMPLSLQAKLLRVLEEGRVLPVGASSEKDVAVRVVAATNVDLQDRIQGGRFREDLYFRLARYPVRVPALRERREDIPLLAQHFLQSFADEMSYPVRDVSAEVLQVLQEYDFPGNVRELRSVIERALIESEGGLIEVRHVHLGFAPVTSVPTRKQAQPAVDAKDLPLDFAEAELILIRRALRAAGGNITEAARLMGINRTKIYRRLAQAEEDAAVEGGADG